MNDKQSRRIALTVAAAFFMETLDGSIITTALPAIGAGFGTSALGVSASVTAYLIAMAVFVPAAGWCGDRFGARRVVASINNTGPGLNQVGPATTFAVLSDFQTWVCSFAMLLGRLEIFTLLVVLTPAFWRK